MIESFVDLTYRGLQLGRRVKLTQVRPSTAYLEVPTPMPVGTTISIATDEGVILQAMVASIHEQVGGSDRPPGMTIKPVLAAEASSAWWQARVALPEADPPAPPNRGKQVTVRPRSHTVPAPPPDAALVEHTIAEPLVALPDPEPPGSKTTVMPAVDQELLEVLTRGSGPIDRIIRRTGEHEIIDDGKSTTVMDAVDPAALGLTVSASGPIPVIDDDDDDDDKKPTPGAPGGTGVPGVKKRKKRR